MLATVSNTPRIRPGKKPTRTAVVGNLLQVSPMGAVALATGVDETDEDEAVGRTGVADVEVELEDEEPGGLCWLAFITQSLFELQLYP
jgi:nicotinamide mononucleotide (NMN) deamidase PncC